MFTLYHDYKSYASQKVRVYLYEKDIKYESIHIDLLSQQHITNKDYRLINPRGLVPSLKDGDTVVFNSTDIMEYVSNNYLPKTDIFFNTSLNKVIHEFCKNDELLHDPHIRILSYSNLWMASSRSDQENNRLLKLAINHPDKDRGKFLEKAVLNKITPEEIELAYIKVYNSLKDMEQKLSISNSDFIFGTEYTMADAVCTVRLFRFGRLDIKIELLEDIYPYTAAFYERVKQRSSFSEIRI